MGQRTSATIKKSQKNLDPEKSLPFTNILSPNGFMPPELIIAILNLSDLPTIHRMAQSCKLWYETCWHSGKLRSWTKIRDNMKKGIYWTETVAAYFNYRPHSQAVCSAVSVDDTMLITNTTVFDDLFDPLKQITRITDLTTGQQKEIPGPAILANGYLLKSSGHRCGRQISDWKHVQVLTKDFEVICDIYRKRVPEDLLKQGNFLKRYSGLKVNRDGSARILLHDFEHESFPVISFEEYDLRTGEMTRELSLPKFGLVDYHGDFAFGKRKNEFIVINLNNVDVVQTFDNVLSWNLHNNRIGLLLEDEVQFYDLTTQPLQNIASMKIDHSYFCENKDERATLKNHGIAFDNSILVVGIKIENEMLVLAIFDLKTKEFLTCIQNPHDPNFRSASRLHVHSPSKIIVDYGNITIYDFEHPYLDQKVDVIRCDKDNIFQYSVEVRNLRKFLSTWSEALDTRSRTLSRINSEGVKERMTVIRSAVINNSSPLVKIFEGGWERTAYTRNTFQYCQAKPRFKNVFDTTSKDNGLESTSEQMCIIYERFNANTNSWELCEPILSASLAQNVVVKNDKKMT
jgi:hypothetical protein